MAQSPAAAQQPAGSSAILASLITATVVSLGLLLISELLRISNTELRQRVYAPRIHRKQAARAAEGITWTGRATTVPTAVPGRTPLAWLGPALRATDADILGDLGVDALVLLKTARLGAYIVALTAVFDLSVVLWANIRGRPLPLGPWASDMDKLTIGHVADHANVLWVHFLSVVYKTAVTLALLYRFSAWFANAQRMACRQRISRPEGTAVLVMHPEGGVTGARSVFSSLYPDSFLTAVPVIDQKLVTKLAGEREQLLTKLEDARHRLDESAEPCKRPTHRTKACGLVGPRVDSIDAWTEQLLDVDARLAAAHNALCVGATTDDAPLREAAFIIFNSARASAIASQVAVEQRWLKWGLSIAPPPNDCYWPNIGRHVPAPVSYALTAGFTALVLFYIVPISAVQAVSTLSNLKALLPFLAPVLKMPVVVAILEGVLPGLALLVFLSVLPMIIRAGAAASGVRTHSGLDVSLLRGLFWFTTINVFLANVLAGSVFAALKHLVDKPTSIFDTLGSTVPGTSRFFISFILLKVIGDSAGAVSGIVASVVYLAKTRLLGGNRNARREATCWAPATVSLGAQLSDTLLVLLLTVVFSTVAPLTHLAGGAYFLLRLVAIKAQLLYTHEPDYDGGGIIWPAVRGRVCVTLMLYQATTAGVIGLKGSAAPASLIIAVLIPGTAYAMRLLHRRFDTLLPGKHAPPLLWFNPPAGQQHAGDVYVDALSEAGHSDAGAPGEFEITPLRTEPGSAAPETYLPPALRSGLDGPAMQELRVMRLPKWSTSTDQDSP